MITPQQFLEDLLQEKTSSTCRSLLSVSVVLMFLTLKASAAPFQNLDFEQANTNRLSTDPSSGLVFGSTADFLPGWQVEQALIVTQANPAFPIQSRTNQVDTIWFRSAPQLLETTEVLTDSSDIFPNVPKVGTYSLLLATCACTGFETYLSLIQRGDVPANATTLTLDGFISWSGDLSGSNRSAEVTMDGIPLERVPPPTGSLTWNAAAFQGQNVALRFTIGPGWAARIDGFRFTLGTAFSGITRNRDGTITIRWSGGGTLEAAAAVNGPWQDVTGATSPYTFTPTGAMLFARIRQ